MIKLLKSKRTWALFTVLLVLLMVWANYSTSAEENEKEISELTQEVFSLKDEKSDLKNDLQLAEEELQEKTEKLEEAEPWFEMSKEKQQREIEVEKERAEKAAKEKAAKEAAEKAAQEAKEKAEKAEKEAKKKAEKEAREAKKRQGYNTGITYSQLARTPDDYEGEKVKFSGKVVQVMEDDDAVQIRLAVNNNYDTIVYAEYDPYIVDSRILEDDQITIMGTSSGIITYESTMGGNISIPSVLVDEIE